MKKISRRTFLKLSSAGAALWALEQGLEGVADAELIGPGGKEVSRTTGKPRRGVATTCQLCPARCGVIAFLDDSGKVVRIEGNPKHPNNQGRICAKGIAGTDVLYDPDRVLYPLRRAGARGEGKWERISWDQAYEELAGKLNELRQRGHPEEFVFHAGSAATDSFIARFMKAYGTPNNIIPLPYADDNKFLAHQLTWGAPIGIPDLAQTRYILNFGANPYEAHLFHLPLVQRLIDARMKNGAKLVTLDVRLSTTAGKSDEWIPLVPGTDGVVALAMANVIVGEGLHDASFLKAWSNYSADQLAQHLAQYTPEVAEAISGVKAADIRRIAKGFAAAKPAVAISGTGVSMHYNGLLNERCVGLLNAVTGNIDTPGGYCLPRSYELAEPDPQPPAPARTTALSNPAGFPFSKTTQFHAVFAVLKETRQRVGVYMTYMHNPVYSSPDRAVTAEVLRNEDIIPYYVAVETHLSESALLADLVLPDATYLERWDVESVPAFDLVPTVSLRQPAVQRRGEAVPFHDVCIQLAKRIGGGMERYFTFGSAEDYVRQVVAKIPGLASGAAWERLKTDGVWYDTNAKPEHRSYEKGGFKTPSGKLEVYSKALADIGAPALPAYVAVPEHQDMDDHQFFLTTYKLSVHAPANPNSKWLLEITHDNPMLINRRVAEELGIKKGDEVQVSSAVGRLIAKAVPTNRIHPRVVAISGGLGHWALGRLAKAESFESSHPDTRLVWWGKHGNGISPNAVIPVKQGLAGGGVAWHDTVVSIAKV